MMNCSFWESSFGKKPSLIHSKTGRDLAVSLLGAPWTTLAMLALALVPLLAWLLYRTPLGLALRAVGENPAAVEAQGLSVYALRLGAVMAGSGLMAVGGAFLTLSAFNAFFFGMVTPRRRRRR